MSLNLTSQSLQTTLNFHVAVVKAQCCASIIGRPWSSNIMSANTLSLGNPSLINVWNDTSFLFQSSSPPLLSNVWCCWGMLAWSFVGQRNNLFPVPWDLSHIQLRVWHGEPCQWYLVQHACDFLQDFGWQAKKHGMVGPSDHILLFADLSQFAMPGPTIELVFDGHHHFHRKARYPRHEPLLICSSVCVVVAQPALVWVSLDVCKLKMTCTTAMSLLTWILFVLVLFAWVSMHCRWLAAGVLWWLMFMSLWMCVSRHWLALLWCVTAHLRHVNLAMASMDESNVHHCLFVFVCNISKWGRQWLTVKLCFT